MPLPTSANQFQLIHGLQVHNTGFHLFFIGGGMARVGDYAYLCIHALFFVGKVVVSMFSHAASDIIRPYSPFIGFTSKSMSRFTN
jgi:hypothetical protein